MPLIVGHRYTIREHFSHEFTQGDKPGVRLQENVRMSPTGPDVPWGASRFRLAEGAASESSRARQLAEINK